MKTDGRPETASPFVGERQAESENNQRQNGGGVKMNGTEENAGDSQGQGLAEFSFDPRVNNSPENNFFPKGSNQDRSDQKEEKAVGIGRGEDFSHRFLHDIRDAKLPTNPERDAGGHGNGEENGGVEDEGLVPRDPDGPKLPLKDGIMLMTPPNKDRPQQTDDGSEWIEESEGSENEGGQSDHVHRGPGKRTHVVPSQPLATCLPPQAEDGGKADGQEGAGNQNPLQGRWGGIGGHKVRAVRKRDALRYNRVFPEGVREESWPIEP